jgi:coenzyme PQQ synthesis protein D (PqqD)
MRANVSGPDRPRARERDLVVQELAGETLVYDLQRHRAHCLSATAAWLWRRCDGKTPIGILAERLSRERGVAVDAEVVRMALHRLARARLLEGPLNRDPGRTFRSRRDLLKRAALLGGLSVLSVAAPTPGQAATCIVSADCDVLPNGQCDNQPCCNLPGRFCRKQGCGNRCCCRA